MALSRLLQPNSTLRVCRFGFSAARVRFCSAVSSDGDDDSPPQWKEEAVAEDTKTVSLEHTKITAVENELGLPKATSLGNVMAEYSGLHKPKTLSGLFMVHNDDPTKTTAKNERREHVETLRDHLIRSENDERPSQSDGYQKVLDLKYSSMRSANDRTTVETGKPRSLASLYQSFENSNKSHEEDAEKDTVKDLAECNRLQNVAPNPTKHCSSTGPTKGNLLNANLQRCHEHDRLNLLVSPSGTPKFEDMDTSQSGFESVDMKEQKEYPKASANDRIAVETDTPRSLASTYRSSENSNKSHEEDAEKNTVKDLVECNRLQNVARNPTKHCSSTGPTKGNSLNASLQRSRNHDRLNLLVLPAGTPTVEDMNSSKSGFESVDTKEPKEYPKVSLPTSNGDDERQIQRENSARSQSEGNNVIVRFLRNSVIEKQIFEHFSKFGEILKIEYPDAQYPLLKTAYIDFKTRKGLEKALNESGSYFHGSQIIVESATSGNRTPTIPVPSLLGDPDIPATLLKNPTRTIRIDQLTQEISSCHIVEALAFCKSNVSGYFLGSSHSVAYVEFETEMGKERALAKQSINVLGRPLVMLRVDCPRTTAVRISSTCSLKMKETVSKCKSLGYINSSMHRTPNVLDVYFKLAEWPNMVKILNRLNGCIVEGRRLQAEPAPIFPPDVLLALWHHPEERKHLKATVLALFHKFDAALDTSELAFLENDFFST